MDNALLINKHMDEEIDSIKSNGLRFPNSYVSSYEMNRNRVKHFDNITPSTSKTLNSELSTNSVDDCDKCNILCRLNNKINFPKKQQLCSHQKSLNSIQHIINNTNIQIKIADLGNACYDVSKPVYNNLFEVFIFSISNRLFTIYINQFVRRFYITLYIHILESGYITR